MYQIICCDWCERNKEGDSVVIRDSLGYELQATLCLDCMKKAEIVE